MNSDRIEIIEQKLNELLRQIGNPNNDLDKDKSMQNDILNLQKKFDSFKTLENKINKMYKDFDVNLVFKQIKSKAESDDVLKDFAIMDTKINTNSENVMYLRKDVDNLVVIYRKLI